MHVRWGFECGHHSRTALLIVINYAASIGWMTNRLANLFVNNSLLICRCYVELAIIRWFQMMNWIRTISRKTKTSSKCLWPSIWRFAYVTSSTHEIAVDGRASEQDNFPFGWREPRKLCSHARIPDDDLLDTRVPFTRNQCFKQLHSMQYRFSNAQCFNR